MKVNFMIIGAMKCGTTSLSRILEGHPKITFCSKKEPDFFSKSNNWKNHLDEYEGLFEKNTGKILGEGSTSYTKFPDFNTEVWADIYEYNSNMKFIYLIRNPIQRVISHYMHDYERGYINTTIDKAILNYPSLINYSRYYTQIKPFINLFGKEKILIIDFEDLIKDKSNTIKKVASFLNINFAEFPDFENVHSNTSLGGKNKINKNLDFLNKGGMLQIRKSFRKFIPSSFRLSLWNLITSYKYRSFSKKPTLELKSQNIILNSLDIEIDALNNLVEKDISSWKRIPIKKSLE